MLTQTGADRDLQGDYRRVWDPEGTKFVPARDGGSQTFDLKLPEWDNKDATVEALLGWHVAPEPTEAVSDPLSVISNEAEKSRTLNAPRRLAYRFMSLPYHLRIEAAQHLNLLSDEDRGQSDTELFRRFLPGLGTISGFCCRCRRETINSVMPMGEPLDDDSSIPDNCCWQRSLCTLILLIGIV